MEYKSDQTFQELVKEWVLLCFGGKITNDKNERNMRFIEESLELVQSLGCNKSTILKLVDYVFDRPIGEPFQEVGGVMVTLAALCEANHLDMMENAKTELKRICDSKVIQSIRQKQLSKPNKIKSIKNESMFD